MSQSTRSVLFVCLGNICRSPAAEGVLQHLINKLDLQDRVMVDSAGTAGYHQGERADSRMRAAAEQRDIELLSLSRKLNRSDLETFDLVIGMDRENMRNIEALHSAPTARIVLLSEYLDDSWPQEVPDPYYGGPQGFETVLDMLQAACPAILSEMIGEE